jgi:hypothetical protein
MISDLKKQLDDFTLFNICINGDGTLHYSDISGVISERLSLGHYKLIHKLNKEPIIVFLTVVNPEDALTSYQITSVTSESIYIFTYDWASGTSLDATKIYIQLK